MLKDVTKGKVTKLPVDIADNLTIDGADELAEKISKELKVQREKVWISTETGSLYVSSPPPEGFVLAKQLSQTDPKNVEEVRNIFGQVAKLTSRGSGKHVVLGPFGLKGDFIQKALDTDGIFWDVGDELWEELQKTGIDMFEANDQFLRLHISNGIDRFDIIHTNVGELIDEFNDTAPKTWKRVTYTEKEVLDLATMPDIPYQLKDNSWVTNRSHEPLD